jgi:hypothetical protein
MKRDELQFSVEIFEKRYQAKDFSGQLLNEFTTAATKQRFVIIIKIIVICHVTNPSKISTKTTKKNKNISDLRSLLFILISINIRPICLNTINGALLRVTQIFI